MDLRRLEYFCQLAKVGNFTRAAKQIGIAQPALSIAIGKLEQELGLKLINRAQKNDLLTSEGKVLLESASKLLAQAKQVKLELQELKDLAKGTVRVGIPTMMGSYYLADSIVAFKKRYPHIVIQLVDQGTAALEVMLENGELDIALLREVEEGSHLRYVGIIEEQMVAGLATEHPLASAATITLAQFCAEPLVLFHEGYFLREAVSEYCKQQRMELDIRMETNLIKLQRDLVINGIGITTCLPKIFRDDPLLSVVPFNPKIVLRLGLAWKKSHYLSVASKAFIEFLKRHSKTSSCNSNVITS